MSIWFFHAVETIGKITANKRLKVERQKKEKENKNMQLIIKNHFTNLCS